MVFHVGVDPQRGRISVYNSETLDIKFYENEEILSTKQIPFMYKKIKEYIDGEFGFLCICLGNLFGMEMRKLFIEYGLKTGFLNVVITDELTAVYLNALFSTFFRPMENDLIFLLINKNCCIWQKRNNEVELLDNIFEVELDSLNEIIMKWCSIKNYQNKTLVILYENEIKLDENHVEKLPSKFKCYAFTFESYAKGALIKTLLTAGDTLCKLISISDAAFSFQTRLAVIFEKKEVIFFDYYQKLPAKESTIIKKCETDRILYIVSCSEKMQIEQSLFIPSLQNFLFTIIIDANGLFHIDLKRVHQNINEEMKAETSFTLQKTQQELFVPTKVVFDGEENDAIGIDLGTMRCCAAVARKNTIETVPVENAGGGRFISTFVAFDEQKEKCGKVVSDRLRNHAQSTAYGTKNIIGKPFGKVKLNSSWPFNVVQKNNSVHLQLQDYHGRTSKYPEEVTAVLLKHIKEVSEEFQARKLSDVVISCPPFFTVAQTDATYVAALLAGWKNVYLINDNIAILASYLFKNEAPKDAIMLIFDLGGETLDLSIVKIVENKKTITYMSADIGGKNFDDVISEYFINELAKNFNITDFGNKKYKFFLKCQEIKESLSLNEEVWLDVDDYDISQSEFIYLTRNLFETKAAGLLEKIEKFVIDNISQKGYLPCHFDKLVLAGGGCRMPMIQKLISKIFPSTDIWCDVNHDELVAVGACYMHCVYIAKHMF